MKKMIYVSLIAAVAVTAYVLLLNCGASFM